MRFDYVTDAFRATLESRELLQQRLSDLDRLLPAQLSVVGNAQSLLSARFGPAIDERPTIRFNRAPVVDEAAQGSRWDFLATSNAEVLSHFRSHPPRFHDLIFTAYLDEHVRNLERIGASVPVTRYPMRLSRELSWQCRARPTVGMQMLYLLDRLGRRDVHIFGFDWKATPTYYDPNRRKDPHQHGRESSLARSLIARNGWTLHTAAEPAT